MRRSLFLLALLASPAVAQQQQAAPPPNAAVMATKMVWSTAHNYLLRAAEQAPDSLYAYQPTKGVRTFGQLLAHVADSRHFFCAQALGEAPQNNEFEKKPTKAEVVAALKSSAAYCEKAYGQSDAAVAVPMKMFGRDANRMFALSLNSAHDFEHYGNVVTYLRINGITPPSSQQ